MNSELLLKILVESDQTGDERVPPLAVLERRIRHLVRMRLAASPLRRLYDSADVWQSVFKDVLGTARRRSGVYVADAEAYLARAAINKLRSYARKERLAPIYPESGEHVIGSDRPVGDVAADREMVAQILSALPEVEREFARMHYLEGHSWQAIADGSSQHAQTIRVRVARAIKRVQQQLAAGRKHVHA